MKRINFLWLVSLFMLVCVGLSACSDDDEQKVPDSAGDLLGTWEGVSEDYYYRVNGGELQHYEEEDADEFRLEFKSDGKCVGSEKYNGNWEEMGTVATWSYRDGKLYMVQVESTEADNAESCSEVLTLNATTLVLKTPTSFDHGTELGYIQSTWRKIK